MVIVNFVPEIYSMQVPYTIVSTLYISLANWDHLGLRNPSYIDINEPLSAFIMKYFYWLWSVIWEFISVVIMFYDVLLFYYVALNRIH